MRASTTKTGGGGEGERPPVIDVLAIVYDAECWEAYLRWFADNGASYLAVFARRFCRMTGVELEAYRAALRRDPHAAVDLLAATGKLGIDFSEHARSLREQGVERQVIVGCPVSLPRGGSLNERLAELAADHEGTLLPWAGLSLRDPEQALAELRHCVLELGMTGAALTHFLDPADPLSPGAHRLYAEAARLGVPLWVHAGQNLFNRASMATCAWRELDEIARAHPELRLVAGHGGWPWVLETIALCQRHPNVYLELSTHRAPNIGAAGSGWEPLLLYGATAIRRKILFGSCEWVHGVSVGELADEFTALDLDPRTLRAWLHDNAARLLEPAPAAV
jgi:predicted TIM-barrel fold metal-dependent hydrolase